MLVDKKQSIRRVKKLGVLESWNGDRKLVLISMKKRLLKKSKEEEYVKVCS